MMCVPECGGVPLASMTCAMSWAVPFTESAVADAVSVIVEPFGARSGTLSQPIGITMAPASAEQRTTR
jgi:hypothetical protein